jgi:hypothetical protein
VEEYLRLQRRYAHLFGDPPRTDVIEGIQATADRNIRRFGLLADPDQGAALPGQATDSAGGASQGEADPARTAEEETNLMRLLESTPRGAQ